MDMARINAIRERNRLAMEQENAAKAAAKVREAEIAAAAEAARAKAEREFPAQMAALADMVLRMPGRGLTRGQVSRLQEIRLRNGIMATVNALQAQK